jgi:hypothetical protein
MEQSLMDAGSDIRARDGFDARPCERAKFDFHERPM